MGVLNQSAGAFSQVVGGLSTIVNGFDTISPYAANIERLSRFYQAMAEADTYKQQNWTKQERKQHLLRVAPRSAASNPKNIDQAFSIDMFQNNGATASDIEMSVVGNNGHSIESDHSNYSSGSHKDGVIRVQRCVDPNDALQIE